MRLFPFRRPEREELRKEAVLRNRITRYMDFTKRRKSLQLVLITTFGLSRSIYSNIVSKTLVLDDLFRWYFWSKTSEIFMFWTNYALSVQSSDLITLRSFSIIWWYRKKWDILHKAWLAVSLRKFDIISGNTIIQRKMEAWVPSRFFSKTYLSPWPHLTIQSCGENDTSISCLRQR